MNPPRKALVLVGHGSARNPGTRLPVCANVQAFRRAGVYDEVRCGLLKEDPHVSVTLDKVESPQITVVPFFISDGYYSRNTIPEAMGLRPGLTRTRDRTVVYTRAVGSHPLFADLLLRHAREAGWMPGDCLVVLGHGTPRNPESGTNVFLQAERVRRRLPGEEVRTMFIDQEPFVQEVWSHTAARRTVIVPLFMADGWHVTETIPEDLGLVDGKAGRDGRSLCMTSAVGTDPGLTEVILEIAREAEAAHGL